MVSYARRSLADAKNRGHISTCAQAWKYAHVYLYHSSFDAKSGSGRQRKMADKAVSLKAVKELMEVQERSFKSFVQMLMDNFTSRIDGLVKDVQSIKDSLQYSQSDIDVLKNDSSSYNKLIENLENKICVIQAELGDAADKRDYLENQSRRNNIRIDGLEEDNNESWEQSETKVRALLQEKLNLDPTTIEIERAHRTGRKAGGKPRQIVAKFLRLKDKISILKSARLLKGSGIFINEDYSQRTIERRHAQREKLMEARKNGKIAYFNVDRLVVKERFPRLGFGLSFAMANNREGNGESFSY